MNTVAHLIIASAALSRPASAKRNWAIAAGALVPDASMFVFFGWSRIQGWTSYETWNVQYWAEPWQTLGALSNSFVLFGLLLGIALWRKWPRLIAASAAALVHIALDFPLHADDAHRHFWPLTDWRFQSPISYWDSDYLGWLGGLIEGSFVLGALALLWRRFNNSRWRAVYLGLAGMQVFFMIILVGWMR